MVAHPKWSGRGGSVRAPHPPAALSGALVLVQAAPGAVFFRPAHRISQALDPDRARRTQRLRLAFANIALGLSLAIWPEEQDDIGTAARGPVLPAPTGPCQQPGLMAYLRHELLSSTSSPLTSPSGALGSLDVHSERSRSGHVPRRINQTPHGAAVFPPAWIARA